MYDENKDAFLSPRIRKFYIGLLVLDFSFMYFCDGVHIPVTREEADLLLLSSLYLLILL